MGMTGERGLPSIPGLKPVLRILMRHLPHQQTGLEKVTSPWEPQFPQHVTGGLDDSFPSDSPHSGTAEGREQRLLRKWLRTCILAQYLSKRTNLGRSLQ